MTKRNQRPQHVENDAGSQKAIIVQFPEIFDCCNPPLVDVVHILFQSPPDIFQDLIDNRDHELRMISVQVIREHCHQPDVAVVELPRLREYLVQRQPDTCIVPVEHPNTLENLVNRAFGKDIIDEMPDEKFHNRSLLLFARCTLRGVALTH